MKKTCWTLYPALLLTLTLSLPAAEPAPETEETIVAPHSELVPIPVPDMSELEESVRAQIGEAQDELRNLILYGKREPEVFSPVFGRLGQLYHAYGFTRSAEASYTNARYLAPQELKWLYSLALLHQEAGELERAADLFAEALELRPDDVATLVHLGEVHFELDRKASAELYLERALQQAPENPAALARLGEIALSRQQYQKAVERLSAALERVPQADRLHYPLGLAYRSLGEMEKARHHLEQRGQVGIKVEDAYGAEIAALKTGERLFLIEGKRAFEVGQYDAAIAAFRRALEAAPQSARARVNLGTALAQSGDVEGGIRELQAALELEGDNATAHFNLGQLLVKLERYQAALQHLATAARLAPEDSLTQIELAALLRRGGLYEEALARYAVAIELQPQSERARLGEAAVLVELERYADALARLEVAHELLPWDGGITHALARLLAASPDAALRDGERALELAQKVFAAQNSIPHALTVAQALAELGRCDEAATWQQQAVEAALQAERPELAAELRPRLTVYLDGPPCRPPIAEAASK